MSESQRPEMNDGIVQAAGAVSPDALSRTTGAPADRMIGLLARAITDGPLGFETDSPAGARLAEVVRRHAGQDYSASPVAEELVAALLTGFYETGATAHDATVQHATAPDAIGRGATNLWEHIARKVARTLDEDERARGRLEDLWRELNRAGS